MDSLEITDCRVFPTKSEKVLAFCSITINGSLVIKSIRIMPGKDGPWVAFPSEKGKDGKYRDTVFFLSKNAKESAVSVVIHAYEKKSGDSENQYPDDNF